MAKIFNVNARAIVAKVSAGPARALLRMGVSPNAVTVAGTLGVVAGALVFAFTGRFITGTVIITLCCFTDLIDGAMARAGARPASSAPSWTRPATGSRTVRSSARRPTGSRSTGGTGAPVPRWSASSRGQAVSYAKARAEGLGMTANVGLVERAERLVGIGDRRPADRVRRHLRRRRGLCHPCGRLDRTRSASGWLALSAGARDRRGRVGLSRLSLNDRAVEWGYAAAWRLIRALPRRAAYAAFRRRRRPGRAPPGGRRRSGSPTTCGVVVGPDMPDDQFQMLVRDAVRSYARYWCDAFRLPSQTRRAEPGRIRPARRRDPGGELRRRPGQRAGPAARRQLGRGRRLGRRDGHADHDRRRAAQA